MALRAMARGGVNSLLKISTTTLIKYVRQSNGKASVALAYLKYKPPTTILVSIVSNHTIAMALH